MILPNCYGRQILGKSIIKELVCQTKDLQSPGAMFPSEPSESIKPDGQYFQQMHL